MKKGRRKKSAASPGGAAKEATPPHAGPRSAGGLRAWYEEKRPVLRFVGIAGGLMALFYWVYYTPPNESSALDGAIRGYLEVYAWLAHGILSVLGFDVGLNGARIMTPGLDTEVVRGCDGIEPMALFVAAMVALPVGFRSKLIGLGVGLPLLCFVNLIRIVSLVFIGMKAPDLFESMHLTVWQTLFVLCTLAVWMLWARWAVRTEEGGDGEAKPA